jgi:small GTP-binding protein
MLQHVVVLCGGSRVGKTSVFRFFQGAPFSDEYSPTVIADHVTYRDPRIESPKVPELNIWDTSGNRRYGDVVRLFIRRVDVLVIVTDSFSADALSELNSWFLAAQRANRSEVPPAIVVLRAKSDIIEPGSEAAGDAIRDQRHCDVLDVSAKTGDGMEDFIRRVYEICDERTRQPPPATVEVARKNKHDEPEAYCKCT